MGDSGAESNQPIVLTDYDTFIDFMQLFPTQRSLDPIYHKLVNGEILFIDNYTKCQCASILTKSCPTVNGGTISVVH